MSVTIHQSDNTATAYRRAHFETTFLSRTVKWFRAEGENQSIKNVRKISAVAIAILLSLTLVGIYLVYEASQEWKRQAQFQTSYHTNQLSKERLDAKADSLIKGEKSSKISILPHPVIKTEKDYPPAYDTLKKMGHYDDGKFDAALERANKALKRNRMIIIPSAYPKLEAATKSKAQLDELYKEAKVIVHYLTMKELEPLDPKPEEYKKIFIPYLDMLAAYLVEHKNFPPDPFEWAKSLD
jgi:hypothetical protein